MSRRSKRGCVIVLIACLVLLCWWVSRRLLPASAPLIEQSTRIDTLVSGDARQQRYEWLSNEAFVTFTSFPPKPLTKVDRRTGAKRVLEALQRRVNKDVDFYNLAISPDGAHALWGGISGDHAVTAAALDGSTLVQRRPKSGEFWTEVSHPMWLSDSRRWVEVLAGEKSLYAVVAGLDASGIIRTIPLGFPKGTRSRFDLMQTRLLGCTQTGRVLATSAGADGYEGPGAFRKINFFDFSIDGTQADVRQYVIRLPKAGKYFSYDIALSPYEEVELSPQGERLAWLVYVRQEPSRLQQWLSRWLPSLRPDLRTHVELQTSKLDGSDMKVIGYVRDQTGKQQTNRENIPHYLRWLPDGQRVSFIYKGALWTVTAQ